MADGGMAVGRLLRVLFALALLWAWGTSGVGAARVTDEIGAVGWTTFREPTNEPDSGANNGFGAQFRDAVNYWNLYNGAFAAGPPDPTANIDVASSVSGSNFMPHHRFVQSSNTNITAKQVRDATNTSGSNFRFTFASGAAADEAYGEETVQISGDPRGSFPHHLSAQGVAGASNTGTFTSWIALQYLTVDGTITGMPAEQTTSTTVAAGASFTLDLDATTSSIAPTSAAQLRVRYGVRRGGAGTTTTGTVDFRALRPSRSSKLIEYTSAGGSTYNIPSGAQRLDIVIIGGGGGGGSGRRAAAATARGGGGGGAGGMMSVLSLTRSQISGDTISVTVGAAGTAGADIGSGATGNGADGGQGGDSSVTVGSTTYTALGGSFGGGGVNVGSSSRGVGAAIVGVFNGGSGGAGYFNSFGDDATAVIGPGPGGGGGGGGIDTANTTYVGGNGFGPAIALTLGGSGGTTLVIATSGSAPSASIGGGGGGGGSATAGLANHRGGNGARGGGGGGGSGLTSATSSSNAGGNGGAGYVAIFAS